MKPCETPGGCCGRGRSLSLGWSCGRWILKTEGVVKYLSDTYVVTVSTDDQVRVALLVARGVSESLVLSSALAHTSPPAAAAASLSTGGSGVRLARVQPEQRGRLLHS